MPKRISKAEHEYAGRKWMVGQPFDVEPHHVELLLALGRIEPEEGEPGYVARETADGEPAEYQPRGTLHLNRKNRKAA